MYDLDLLRMYANELNKNDYSNKNEIPFFYVSRDFNGRGKVNF